MTFQFNSTEPGQASPRQGRKLHAPSLGVIAYIVAIISPLVLLPAAHIRGNTVYLGASFRNAVHCLFLAPLLGLLLGLVTLLCRPSAISRKFAIAAIVIGLFGTGTVAYYADLVSGAGTAQHNSTCMSNLQHIAEAVRLYTEDYGGMLPSSYLYGRSKTWSPADFTAFASRQGDVLGDLNGSRSTWLMLLHQYNADEKMMWCPSDPNALSDSPDAIVSYYWKAAVDRAWYGGFRKLSDYAAPSDQILAYERKGWHYGADGFAEGAQFNCCFVDGHVETGVVSQSGYGQSEIPPGPLPKSGIGEPAWFNCPLDDLGHVTTGTVKKGTYWNPTKWADE